MYHRLAGLLARGTYRAATRVYSTEVPKDAEVVVIGGGIIGCSTLYHLSKRACRAVLVERDRLTSGTTWHTAGLVWRLRPSDTDIQVLNHTRHLLKHALRKETGLDTGFIENGGLFLANNKERLDEYKRLMTIGRVLGVESYILTPAETKKLYPLLNVDDLYGALYSPGDGCVDPTSYCAALTKAATRNGATIKEHCPVLDIETKLDDFGVTRVTGVRTSKGFIKTSQVVNCSGVWAPKIGAMVGAAVPLIPIKHAYITTEKIAGIENMPNVRDHDLSLYFRLQGDALAVGGYEPNPIILDKVDDNFSFGLYDLDMDVFGIHLQQGIKRCPILEKTGLKSTICGPESFTADHKPLLGEDVNVRGFFHGCGFNSLGINGSGGCGRELADWVLDGRPQLDMFAYDIRRFSPRVTSNLRWLRERSHEAYVKSYSIVYPHDEPLAARLMMKDPLFDDFLNQGCVFQERQGFERPGWFAKDGRNEILEYDYYESVGRRYHQNYKYRSKLSMDYTFEFPKQHNILREEALACREHVAIFNMTYFGKFLLTGPDAQKAADWLCSNDVHRKEGSTVYTCLLNKNGRVEADLTFSVLKGDIGATPVNPAFDGVGFYIVTGGGPALQAWTHIKQTIEDQQFQCHLFDYSDQIGILSIQGPQSRELLQALTSADLSDEAFPFSTHQMINFAGHPARAIRWTFVGELGWELHVPYDGMLDVYRTIMRAGEKFGLRNAGYRALDSLSIETGHPHWQFDLRLDDTLLEAGLGFICKLDEDIPFLGRQALEDQKKRGLRKRIACFTIDDRHAPLVGMEAIYRNGCPVGFLRRANFGFALNQSIGYGYLIHPDPEGIATVDWLVRGNYAIESYGRSVAAKLHTCSPFDPQGYRIKGLYDMHTARH
ncbi:sarcosine dehydrogenase, mitochondrial-like isoform X2 [Varroa jacobsoni]|uniref:sarcosine dehydrogenase, mitochondrial-like isoform X2 n=1 Tax=Varroa jacobsoni TaxID=62625 RepID=UPI000BF3C156|nr:sarcosine dehydrogenase, mitochondrial-like isoform X2 [Varroa jacobsoni]